MGGRRASLGGAAPGVMMISDPRSWHALWSIGWRHGQISLPCKVHWPAAYPDACRSIRQFDWCFGLGNRTENITCFIFGDRGPPVEDPTAADALNSFLFDGVAGYATE